MHFGIARAHSHAAPPNSTNIPVDSEKLFVVKRITTYKSRNKGKRETQNRNFYASRSGFPQRRQFAFERAVMQWQAGHMVWDW